MTRKSIAINIFSNWTFIALTILIAFVVSPIMVNQLGPDAYGVWVLMVSIGGYFTVLDFGINTALVRFISKFTTLKDYSKAAQVYSSSFVFFICFGSVVIAAIAIFGLFFKEIFNVETFSSQYLYLVVLIVGIDLTINLVFGVLTGTLRGLQKFFEVNVILILAAVIKNTILVLLLFNGHSLLSIAILQAAISCLKYIAQYLYIKSNYTFLSFRISYVNKSTLKQLFDYSIYSFLIALSLRVLFYTDSIVIGSMINLEGVTFYAIASMIVENLEKFIWAIIAVLIPVISSKEAVGKVDDNRKLYIIGTKYTLFLCTPVIFVLFLIGDDFIRLWMGEAYAEPSGHVLNILLLGYLFALSQLIAHGILKGISRHKILAYILCIEAVFNLVISILLAPTYGINGVAYGTAIPLVIANVIFIPYFTCKELNLNYFHYLSKSILNPLLVVSILFLFFYGLDISVVNFLEVIVFSLFIAVLLGAYFLYFHVEPEHQTWLINRAKEVARVFRN